MPIDSLCTGCGKTLRVGDEYAGRKARCPLCGAIYEVALPFAPPNPDEIQAGSHSLPTLSTGSDSWNSLPTQQPLGLPVQGSTQPTGQQSTTSSNASSVLEQFFVRTPNATIYGPVTYSVVLEWMQQGRLDETCHIRPQSSEQWIGIPAWQFQQKQRTNPVVGMSSSVTVNQPNYFGTAPVSTNQSAGYTRTGGGIWVLVLGILSWVFCVTIFGAPICAIIAIVMSQNELQSIRLGKSPTSERPMVLVGMWLAILNLVLSAGMLIFVFVLVILNP